MKKMKDLLFYASIPFILYGCNNFFDKYSRMKVEDVSPTGECVKLTLHKVEQKGIDTSVFYFATVCPDGKLGKNNLEDLMKKINDDGELFIKISDAVGGDVFSSYNNDQYKYGLITFDEVKPGN